MAADSSFDIVSKIDRQEVDNALNQAAREIATRYDFKNTGASIEWSGEYGVEVTANADERALAVLDVFKDKLIKRGISLKALDAAEPRQSGKEVKLSSTLTNGISQEQAKKLSKLIRDDGPKGVKVQIQGEELRAPGQALHDRLDRLERGPPPVEDHDRRVGGGGLRPAVDDPHRRPVDHQAPRSDRSLHRPHARTTAVPATIPPKL